MIRLTAVALGAVLVLAACAPAADTATSPSPSTTPSPTASGTPSPSPEPVSYEGRNPSMDDAEALYRAEHPATGETWLDAPVEVDVPLPDSVVREQGLGSDRWYRVGERDGAEIFRRFGPFGSVALVEVAADGVAREVVAPLPSDSLDGADATLGIATADVFYDSLALPHTWTSPEGAVYELRGARYGAMVLPDDVTAARVANARLVRTTVESGYFGSNADLGAAAAVTVGYVLVDASGRGLGVSADPLGTRSADPTFTAGTRTPADPTYVDLADQECAGTPSYLTSVTGTPAAQWRQVGSTPTATLYVPTADNPIARRAWEMWKDKLEWSDGAPPLPADATIDEFTGAGAVIATPSADGERWFVEIESGFSARAWC